MILIKNYYAFILYVSDSGLQCKKHNSYWYRVQYKDRQTPTRATSFPLVRTTTLGHSVYPDIALHISNYYINIVLYSIMLLYDHSKWYRFQFWWHDIYCFHVHMYRLESFSGNMLFCLNYVILWSVLALFYWCFSVLK